MNAFAKRKRIRYILFIFYYVACLKPDAFQQISLLNALCNTIRLIAFFDCVCYFAYKSFCNKQLHPFLFLSFLYLFFPAIPTLIYSGDIGAACSLAIRSLVMAMLIVRASNEEPRIALDCLYPCIELLIYINLATILLYPGGMHTYETDAGWISEEVWFLGLRNGHPPYLLLGCYLTAMNLQCRNTLFSRIRAVVLYAATILTVILLKSGGGIVALILFWGLFAVFFLFRFLLRFELGILFHVLLWLMLVSIGSQFLEIVASYGKGASFSSRLYIWHTSLEKFLKSPLFGYGFLTTEQLTWLRVIAAGATTSHNSIVDILYRGGVIEFLLFILLLLTIARKANLQIRSRMAVINSMTIGFIAFFFLAQSEGMSAGVVIFSFLAVLYITPDMDEIKTGNSTAIPFEVTQRLPSALSKWVVR